MTLALALFLSFSDDLTLMNTAFTTSAPRSAGINRNQGDFATVFPNINFDRISSTVGNKPEVLVRLAKLALTVSREQIEDINSYAKAQDRKKLELALHAMRNTLVFLNADAGLTALDEVEQEVGGLDFGAEAGAGVDTTMAALAGLAGLNRSFVGVERDLEQFIRLAP